MADAPNKINGLKAESIVSTVPLTIHFVTYI